MSFICMNSTINFAIGFYNLFVTKTQVCLVNKSFKFITYGSILVSVFLSFHEFGGIKFVFDCKKIKYCFVLFFYLLMICDDLSAIIKSKFVHEDKVRLEELLSFVEMERLGIIGKLHIEYRNVRMK
ncbi:hypothetical protein HPP92_027221 [Vanilla planifolia]|uniref:Uncharacterized protein n=1 Tax=Vanilla planifolia TaxID=51239 RepID=A0A835P9M3_VANPL|nr:hypothetical protein HPP92_027221 [Vanilla planifolia]